MYHDKFEEVYLYIHLIDSTICQKQLGSFSDRSRKRYCTMKYYIKIFSYFYTSYQYLKHRFFMIFSYMLMFFEKERFKRRKSCCSVFMYWIIVEIVYYFCFVCVYVYMVIFTGFLGLEDAELRLSCCHRKIATNPNIGVFQCFIIYFCL